MKAVRYMEENLNKTVKKSTFFEVSSKFDENNNAFMPHLSCECLSKLEGNDFYSNIKWPKIEKTLLVDDKRSYCDSGKWKKKRTYFS